MSDDCISRQAVLGCLTATKLKELKKYYLILHARGEIKNLPPVAPKPKTGKWLEEETPDGDTTYRCSECDEVFCLFDGTPMDYLYYFCPNCGAKMEVSNG